MVPKTRAKERVRTKLMLSPTLSTQMESPAKTSAIQVEGSTVGHAMSVTKKPAMVRKLKTLAPAIEILPKAAAKPSPSAISSKEQEETNESPVKNLVNEPEKEAADETSTLSPPELTPTLTLEQSSSTLNEQEEEQEQEPLAKKPTRQTTLKKRAQKDPSLMPSFTGGDEEDEDEEAGEKKSSGESKDQKDEEVDILCLEGIEKEPTPPTSKKGKVVMVRNAPISKED